MNIPSSAPGTAVPVASAPAPPAPVPTPAPVPDDMDDEGSNAPQPIGKEPAINTTGPHHGT